MNFIKNFYKAIVFFFKCIAGLMKLLAELLGQFNAELEEYNKSQEIPTMLRKIKIQVINCQMDQEIIVDGVDIDDEDYKKLIVASEDFYKKVSDVIERCIREERCHPKSLIYFSKFDGNSHLLEFSLSHLFSTRLKEEFPGFDYMLLEPNKISLWCERVNGIYTKSTYSLAEKFDFKSVLLKVNLETEKLNNFVKSLDGKDNLLNIIE